MPNDFLLLVIVLGISYLSGDGTVFVRYIFDLSPKPKLVVLLFFCYEIEYIE